MLTLFGRFRPSETYNFVRRPTMVADIERLPFSKYLDPPLERMLISSFKLNEINKKLFKKILFWKGGGEGYKKIICWIRIWGLTGSLGKKFKKGALARKGWRKKRTLWPLKKLCIKKENNSCHIIYLACPYDNRVDIKEFKKIVHYQDLEREKSFFKLIFTQCNNSPPTVHQQFTPTTVLHYSLLQLV